MVRAAYGVPEERMKQPWLWLAIQVLVLATWAPRQAAADSSVVVLGVRSLDGDDDLARQVSAALRDAARKIEGYQVSDRDVSLAQMSLAHGCDEPDARCMADISSTLKADRLIYGTTARVGNDVQVALFSFDSVSGQVEASVEQKLSADKLSGSALGPTARQLVERLAGKHEVGTLRILADSPSAEVSLDGQLVGELNSRGELLLSEVNTGKHVVTVRDRIQDRVRDVPVMVGADATATLRIVLKPPTVPLVEDVEVAPGPVAESPTEPQPSSLKRIIGWTSIGIAVGLTAATIYSWVRIGHINDDPNLTEYRSKWPSNVSDVCVQAEHGRLVQTMDSAHNRGLESSARSLCNEADTLQVLQYVFLGGALAFGGVGTYLLLTDPKRTKKVSFRPTFRHGLTMMRASVRF
jgi:hypothetical protein